MTLRKISELSLELAAIEKGHLNRHAKRRANAIANKILKLAAHQDVSIAEMLRKYWKSPL